VQLAPNLSEFAQSSAPQDLFDGYYFRVLQFSNLPTPAIKAAMKAEGILLLDYLPKTHLLRLSLNVITVHASLHSRWWLFIS
jgi:hypothetical protein